MLIADPTGKANLVLWEADIDKVSEGRSYQLNRLEVQTYLGNTNISFPQCGASVDDISDIEDVNNFVDDTKEQYCAKAASIAAVNQFENCINCKKNVKEEPKFGVCDTCGTVQKLRNPRISAKLFIQCHAEGQTLSLRAYNESLKLIAESEHFTPQDLLSATFDALYNDYNIITKVSRS